MLWLVHTASESCFQATSLVSPQSWWLHSCRFNSADEFWVKLQTWGRHGNSILWDFRKKPQGRVHSDNDSWAFHRISHLIANYSKWKWWERVCCSVLLLASWCFATTFGAHGVFLGCKLLVGESRALLWWAGGNLLRNFLDCFLFSCAQFRGLKDSIF